MCSLSEKYFEMNKKQCREALDIYKRFLVRMERVSEFLKVAEVSEALYFAIVNVVAFVVVAPSLLWQCRLTSAVHVLFHVEREKIKINVCLRFQWFFFFFFFFFCSKKTI